MKKVLKFILVSALAVVLCLSVMLAGCTSDTAVGISSISLTSSEGNVDTYTIYYTDGNTSTFTVTNGEDGANGTDGADGKDGADGESTLTVEELYNYYKSYYNDEDMTYAEFLELYLSAPTDNSSAINSCLLSTAKVYTEFDFTYSTQTRPGSTSTVKSAIAEYTGSAILYSMGDEYSYFVTNYHVVYDTDYANGLADRIHLYLYGSESAPTGSDYITYGGYTFPTSITYDEYAIECTYIGGSASSDIAVLRVDTEDIMAINSDFKAVTLADGYHVGETAIAIGNAEGEGLSVTQGIVSVDSEYISLSVDGTTRSYRSMRIDTAVYSGNSGGGLFNKYGQLIGIVNAASTSGENMNYAIPLSIVTGTVDNILYYYLDNDDTTTDSYTVTLGITYTTANSRYVYDSVSGYGEINEDMVISAVTEDSIASGLGLAVGDVIDEMIITDNVGNTETHTITRAYNVTDLLLTLRAGYKISFTYTRDDVQTTTKEYSILSSDLVARG